MTLSPSHLAQIPFTLANAEVILIGEFGGPTRSLLV